MGACRKFEVTSKPPISCYEVTRHCRYRGVISVESPELCLWQWYRRYRMRHEARKEVSFQITADQSHPLMLSNEQATPLPPGPLAIRKDLIPQ